MNVQLSFLFMGQNRVRVTNSLLDPVVFVRSAG